MARSGQPTTAWSTIFYLFLLFVAPLAFIHSASAAAESNETSEQANYGTGECFHERKLHFFHWNILCCLMMARMFQDCG